MTADLRIEAVHLACGRAAALVRWKMSRGRASLSAVASSAAFLGVLATVVGLFDTLPGFATERSTIRPFVTAHLAYALLPTAVGVLLALLAYWGQSCIGRKVEQFDGEMRAATLDLANTLARVFPLKREARPWKWTRRRRLAAVQRACERAAAGVRIELGRRRKSLASIRVTAQLLGRLGTVLMVMSSFTPDCCYGGIAARISTQVPDFLLPIAVGVLASALAVWVGDYIAVKIDLMDGEMHAATLDLMNRLSLLMDSGTNLRPAPAPGAGI
jgi:biopolymer transport protein ExbB/TolQ